MQQIEKYQLAMRLLRELNCPERIMDELAIWGLFVYRDEIKLHNRQKEVEEKEVTQ